MPRKKKKIKVQPSLKPKYSQLKSKIPSRFSTPWTNMEDYVKQCERSEKK